MNQRLELEATLRRLNRVKRQPPPPAATLSADVTGFFKQVDKRQRSLGKIAQVWEQLVPPDMQQHSALEGLSRGTLTVLVDSSSHLYHFKQLLLDGLEGQLLEVCRAHGLRKVSLRLGRWYREVDGQRRPVFD
jgi:hypothetical protein